MCYLINSVLIIFVDPDGDIVVFSTDEELLEALGYVNDGIFKIYITLKGKRLVGGLLSC